MTETEMTIEDCEKRSDKLSDWELQFIDSIRRQWDATGSLSVKQEDVLDRIWHKVTQ